MTWLKLIGLFLLTVVIALAVIPVRTHAETFDPGAPNDLPSRSLSSLIGAMYLTPGTALFLLVLLAISGLAALKIARGQW